MWCDNYGIAHEDCYDMQEYVQISWGNLSLGEASVYMYDDYGCEVNACTDNSLMEAAAAAAQAGNVEALAGLILASERQLQLNESRDAVQGFGCKGQVVLHVPLPHRTVALVAGAMQAAAGPSDFAAARHTRPLPRDHQ